ncbi:MAG TPA: START domain-containing protein [Turneriella sp.]|nr:START domain-containing protein [Turneriella sp.]
MRAAFLILFLFSTIYGGNWETINNEDGIIVFRKSQPNSNFFIFKGEGNIDAPLSRILSIVQDTRLMPRWVSSCVEARLIEKNYDYATLKTNINDYYQIIYGRAAVPWPFRDRDYVLKGKIAYEPKDRSISIHLVNIEHNKQPRRANIERMRVLRIEFILIPMSTTRTKIIFTVALDPGGNIPAWAVNYMSKNEPLKTIKFLRLIAAQNISDRKAEAMIERQLQYLDQHKKR